MDEFVKEALEQLEKARKSGRPETVLEALEELIVFCEDERANLPYIEEMEKLAHSSGNKKLHLTALSFRCCAHQELENWPELRSAAEEFHRQAHEITDRRIVEGGYRLGRLLEEIFGAGVSRGTP